MKYAGPFQNLRASVVFNEGIRRIKTIAKVIMKLSNNKSFICSGTTSIAALITIKQKYVIKKSCLLALYSSYPLKESLC